MSLIIDSAPDCIQHVDGAKPPDDVADFVVQAPFLPCREEGGGFMTFGPGTVYGDEGHKAADAYYVLTYIGIGVMLAIIILWVLYENRRLLTHAARIAVTGTVGTIEGKAPPAGVAHPGDREIAAPGTTPKEA
jgi:hypothetical protein